MSVPLSKRRQALGPFALAASREQLPSAPAPAMSNSTNPALATFGPKPAPAPSGFKGSMGHSKHLRVQAISRFRATPQPIGNSPLVLAPFIWISAAERSSIL